MATITPTGATLTLTGLVPAITVAPLPAFKNPEYMGGWVSPEDIAAAIKLKEEINRRWGVGGNLPIMWPGLPKNRYPPGPVTPHGAYHLLKGDLPEITLRSYDNSMVFHLMGGQAIPDRINPECAHIKGIKGLVPPWQTVDQKGATQDGVTFIDALYDPIEVDVDVVCKGRTPATTRRVVRDLMASIDPIQQAELSFFSAELGRWWSPVRWFKTPLDALGAINTCRQEVSLRLRADSGFWRSYDDVAMLRSSHRDDSDDFETDYPNDLGTAWNLTYSGAGAGKICTSNGQAHWVNSGTTGRTVICNRTNYSSTGDNQVIEITLGAFPKPTLWDGSAVYIMGRMDSVWNGNGVAACIEQVGPDCYVILSRFNDFVETAMSQVTLTIPPISGEKFALVCGFDEAGSERKFSVLRNGLAVLTYVEAGVGSVIGSDYRSAGFGMRAGDGVSTQATPASVYDWMVGDNTSTTTSGSIIRTNIGDQPRWDNYTCYGPGTFTIGDGPDSASSVEFGPLLENQIVQIRTDPRRRAVVDLTSTPPTPQHLNLWQQAIRDFLTFATGNNVPPLLQQIMSLFGIQAPQGNLYSLLKGRFTKPIPAKSPGAAAKNYQISCSITGGDAHSKIVASGTPLRRYPM